MWSHTILRTSSPPMKEASFPKNLVIWSQKTTDLRIWSTLDLRITSQVRNSSSVSTKLSNLRNSSKTLKSMSWDRLIPPTRSMTSIPLSESTTFTTQASRSLTQRLSTSLKSASITQESTMPSFPSERTEYEKSPSRSPWSTETGKTEAWRSLTQSFRAGANASTGMTCSPISTSPSTQPSMAPSPSSTSPKPSTSQNPTAATLPWSSSTLNPSPSRPGTASLSTTSSTNAVPSASTTTSSPTQSAPTPRSRSSFPATSEASSPPSSSTSGSTSRPLSATSTRPTWSWPARNLPSRRSGSAPMGTSSGVWTPRGPTPCSTSSSHPELRTPSGSASKLRAKRP